MMSKKDRRQFLQWGVKASVLLGVAPIRALADSADSSLKVSDITDDRMLEIKSGEGWLFSESGTQQPRLLALGGGACGSCSGDCAGNCACSSAASAGNNCGASEGGGGNCDSGGGGGQSCKGGYYPPTSSSCFTGDTPILASNERWVPIESLVVGQSVLGRDGQVNMIVEIEKVPLAGRDLFGFEQDKMFFTHEHPFWSAEGWRSVNPTAFTDESAHLERPQVLEVGNKLLHKQEGWKEVSQIFNKPESAQMVVYNLILSGDSTYWANGYLVHNKN